ncbi:HAMP domain-containing histidine kinase [Nocardioides albidus]|uniref:histidine kinase n=1 Tax=Nocardioides albidus TaxID=1517589 RepID=A0A5C4VUK6_9ACTN|nr:HAMP domain-containing sensor histidine kinase [Nocardioides albidus]TNM39573.1 HAMP domain-containing histidine kinase [Nocardioides albidus]
MRLRTTLAAVLVVAVALVLAACLLVLAVRSSLRDAAETTAEHRAVDLVTQVDAGGLPVRGESEAPDDEPDDEPDEIVWQVADADGRIVAASASLRGSIPLHDGEVVSLRGGEHSYLVVTEDTGDGGVVAVAVSLEDVDETTAALGAPLLLGVPLLLLVVGATTWLVVGRALRPVERIRAEVERISGASLERRVPVPPGKDEIGRLARTMNLMLGRLHEASERQQQFVSDASHELRSPVASLRQAAEVARAHPEALPDGELAATVLEESVRMQLLVDQLLVLARAGEGASRVPWADVDVDDLVLAHARRGARPGPRVDTSGVGPGRVRGDAVALGQVVRNLLDNALRHAERSVVVRVEQRPDAVVLTVEDDGPGVPVAERERVFERFRRLDDARTRDAGGSGLGLAIVREVVAAHGGAVQLDSSPLGGARFVVRLPS